MSTVRTTSAVATLNALDLLNPWQRNFPLEPEPYAKVASTLGVTTNQILSRLTELQHQGSFSRIGGVFDANAGGAALLAAMAVPEHRLDEVATLVSSHPGVNHNYERENHFNLWFVMTASCEPSLEAAMKELEEATGLPALRLRLVRPFRIDLGFDLRQPVAPCMPTTARSSPALPVSDLDRPLAALVEEGLPLVDRPYDAWAVTLNRSTQDILSTLGMWLKTGMLRRWGVIVRHHEFGFDANAMSVFSVPPEQIEVCGALLACQPGVTLAYQREPARDWPYNLYCMVHGKDRQVVLGLIEDLKTACGLTTYPHAVLFSRQRFKQMGARRFRTTAAAWRTPLPSSSGVFHVVA